MTRSAKALSWALIAAVALLGAKRLVHQSRALLFSPVYPAAVDFKLRYHETQVLFDGRDVYREPGADYPPAAYVVLWPFMGPWTLPTARAIWCVASLISILVLSRLFRAAVPGPPLARALATLLPWAASPSAITIGAGQLGLIVLAASVGGVLLLRRQHATGPLALAAVLLVVGLAKPSISAPLCLATATTPAGSLAALCGVAMYSATTAFACGFQPTSFAECATAWIHKGVGFTAMGYGNLATWASELGYRQATLPLAALCLVLGAAWLWRARASDPWTQLGVLAVLARLWTYHYSADDVLIYLPMIAILRQTARMPPREAWRWSTPVAFAGLVLALPTRWRDDGAWPNIGAALATVSLLAVSAALVALEERRRREATLARIRP